MSPSNTTFFCIPGAFCPGAYFDRLAPLLRDRGFATHALDLPSMSPTLKAEGKAPGLYDDADFVREAVLRSLDEGKDVVLVASSYGGAVTFEACQGITAEERAGKSGGQLKHLVLLGVLLCEPGPTIKELLGAEMPHVESGDQSRSKNETHLPALPASIAGAALCGSLSKEEQEHYGAMGVAMSTKTFVEPMRFAAWEKVPTTLVIGDKDLALKPAMQHEYFDKGVEKGVIGLKKVFVHGGDHLTILSHPEEVLKVCLEAAGNA